VLSLIIVSAGMAVFAAPGWSGLGLSGDLLVGLRLRGRPSRRRTRSSAARWLRVGRAGDDVLAARLLVSPHDMLRPPYRPWRSR